MKKSYLKALALGLSASLALPTVGVFADQEYQDSSKVLANVNSRFAIHIPKLIVLDVDEQTRVGTGAYKVGVEGDIDYNTSVYVVPQPQFDFSSGSDTVVANVSQTKTEWSYTDLQGEEIWGDGSVVANDLTAGKWEGIFYFNIDMGAGGADVPAPADKAISGAFEDSDTPVDAGTYQMGQGQSASIAMTYNGKNVTSQTTYSSDNERITVDSKGRVDTSNAVGGDEATITATYTETTVVAGLRSGLLNPMAAATGVTPEAKTLTAQFKIQVIGIAFDKDTVTVRPGDTVQVTANILPGSVDGTVKWTLNGLNFGTEGNTVTINIGEDATPGNYTLVASYGGTTETLNIKVSNGPEVSGVVDGGQYTGPVEVTVEEGSTVTVDGSNVSLVDNKFTVSGDGQHVVVVSKGDMQVTYNITIQHEHTYVDGFCSICGCKDSNLFGTPGLYTASGKKLATWLELTMDYGIDFTQDYASTDHPVENVINNTGVNSTGARCVVIFPDDFDISTLGDCVFYGCYTIKTYPEIEHEDVISSIIKDSTCTSTGSCNYTCKFCGQSKFGTIPMKDHNTVEGVCTTCGFVDVSVNERHTFVNGKCSICNKRVPGVYEYESNRIIVSFEMLKSTYSKFNTSTMSSLYEALAATRIKYSDRFSDDKKYMLVLPDTVTTLSSGMLLKESGRKLYNSDADSTYDGKMGLNFVVLDINDGCTEIEGEALTEVLAVRTKSSSSGNYVIQDTIINPCAVYIPSSVTKVTVYETSDSPYYKYSGFSELAGTLSGDVVARDKQSKFKIGYAGRSGVFSTGWDNIVWYNSSFKWGSPLKLNVIYNTNRESFYSN